MSSRTARAADGDPWKHQRVRQRDDRPHPGTGWRRHSHPIQLQHRFGLRQGLFQGERPTGDGGRLIGSIPGPPAPVPAPARSGHGLAARTPRPRSAPAPLPWQRGAPPAPMPRAPLPGLPHRPARPRGQHGCRAAAGASTLHGTMVASSRPPAAQASKPEIAQWINRIGGAHHRDRSSTADSQQLAGSCIVPLHPGDQAEVVRWACMISFS